MVQGWGRVGRGGAGAERVGSGVGWGRVGRCGAGQGRAGRGGAGAERVGSGVGWGGVGIAGQGGAGGPATAPVRREAREGPTMWGVWRVTQT